MFDSEFFFTVIAIYCNSKYKLKSLCYFSFFREPVPKDSSYPDWKPINENRSPHMYLNLNSTLKSEYLEQRAHFWDKIYDKYYKGPQLPSK